MKKPAASVKPSVRRPEPLVKRPVKPSVNKLAPSAKKSAASVKKLAPSARKPAASVKKLAPSARKPAASVKKLAPSARKPAASVKKLATSARKRAPISAATHFVLKRKQLVKTDMSCDLTQNSDEPSPKSSASSVRVEAGDVVLRSEQRDILLHPAALLDDLVISAGQNMLKQTTNLAGFQHSVMGQTCSFKRMNEPFVQILNNGRGHWLAISTVGAEEDTVNIYDSMFVSVNKHIKEQIAAIVSTSNKEITLNFIDVQCQSGTYDCGLFALAFATCFVFNVSPADQQYDQKAMRKHLYQCMLNNTL